MMLKFEVADTGIGMTEGEKNEVFGKFIQVGTEVSSKGLYLESIPKVILKDMALVSDLTLARTWRSLWVER